MHNFGCLVSDKFLEIVMLSSIIHHCPDEHNLNPQRKDVVVNSPILTEKLRYLK